MFFYKLVLNALEGMDEFYKQAVYPRDEAFSAIWKD